MIVASMEVVLPALRSSQKPFPKQTTRLFLGALLSDLGQDRVLVEGDLVPGVVRVLGRALDRRGFDLEALVAIAA